MKAESDQENPWSDDRLNYSEYGKTFTNLAKSITKSRVISIEAGFGQGKTYFRRAWAQHLRNSGEFVIEFDALETDQSGDPVLSFVGALITAKSRSGRDLKATIKEKSLKLAGVASRSLIRAALREGADEILEASSDWLKDHAPDIVALDAVIDRVEAQMSNAAGKLLATHLAAERARNVELPTQIDALRDALTDQSENNRVIVLIDELDRCHPEYAISLLEAMKLVFGRDGFVFFLMVNPTYLESIAHHRFGIKPVDELYLDKFVDLRLRLGAPTNRKADAARDLMKEITVTRPFGLSEDFTVEAASDLVASIIGQREFSFRQIKRIIERVDLATRCYRDQRIDLPLLVFLAFQEVVLGRGGEAPISAELLPRANLSPTVAERLLSATKPSDMHRQAQVAMNDCEEFVRTNCRALLGLDQDLYDLPPPQPRSEYFQWYLVLAGLGPRYIPMHQEILVSVHRLQV